MKVPDDVGIIGFDEPDAPTPIPLSVALQPMREIGRVATQLLIDKIRGDVKGIKQIRLKPELIQRKSSGIESPH